MATRGIVDATNIRINADGTKIAMITNGTLSFTVGERDQTNNDDAGWTRRDYGTLTATMSGDSFFAFDAAYGYDDLLEKMLDKEKLLLEWTAGAAGDYIYTGDFILTSIEKSGSTGQDLKYSYSFSSSGEIESIYIENDEADILTFTVPGQVGAADIDTTAFTIDIDVPFGTDVTDLIATFTVSNGASVSVLALAQVSGTTENDFTSPLTYSVFSEDEVNLNDYVVTITILPA